mmetsp:Transcript_15251/g.35478  ORF Transcript_15251/g.35478 Transcript_15251/m.35478 type:complete len:159 (+) Transcript_15251:202-678(+)
MDSSHEHNWRIVFLDLGPELVLGIAPAQLLVAVLDELAGHGAGKAHPEGDVITVLDRVGQLVHLLDGKPRLALDEAGERNGGDERLAAEGERRRLEADAVPLREEASIRSLAASAIAEITDGVSCGSASGSTKSASKTRMPVTRPMPVIFNSAALAVD